MKRVRNVRNRKRRGSGTKWYDATSIEMQYVKGAVDADLFYEYLKEYAKKKQTETEVKRAVFCKVGRKQSYKWLWLKERWIGVNIGEFPCWPTEKEIEEYFSRDSQVKWWTDEKWCNHHPIDIPLARHWEDLVAEKLSQIKNEETDSEGEIDRWLKEIEK